MSKEPLFVDSSVIDTDLSEVTILPHETRDNRFRVVLEDDRLRQTLGQVPYSLDSSGIELIKNQGAWDEQFDDNGAIGIVEAGGEIFKFRTGGFEERTPGRYVAVVKPLYTTIDAPTAKFKNASFQLKSSEADQPIVEGLVGLAAVGGGIALYYKLRANRSVEALEEELVDLNADLEKAKGAAEGIEVQLENQKKAYEIITRVLDEYEGLVEQMSEVRQKLVFDIKNIIPRDEKERLKNRLAQLQERASEIEDGYDFKSLDELKEIVRGNFESLGNKIENLDKALEKQRAIQSRINLVEDAQDIIVRDLQVMPSELLENYDFFDRVASNAQLGVDDPAEIFLKEAKDIDSSLENILDQLYRRSDLSKSEIKEIFDSNIERVIRQSNRQLLSEVTEQLGIVRNGTAVESVDPIADIFARQFGINKGTILRADNITGSLLDELPQLGYGLEADMLIGGLESAEFLESIGSLVAPLSAGTLEAFEALEVVDVLAGSLGEGVVIEGLAGVIGGEFLLGEIGFDLIELALFL